jgi:hypothetical protein
VNPFRPEIPPHVAEVIRWLHADLKRSIKSAVRAIAADPHVESCSSESLMGSESISCAAFASSMPSMRKHALFARWPWATVGMCMRN